MKRVSCFIDGFNLYHAIHELKPRQHNLKWVDLHGLVSAFVVPSKESLTHVFYFSAYATWIPDAYTRHRQYVKALEMNGVTPIMGQFKKKKLKCGATCGQSWVTREEKESDVNIAIQLLHHAHIDTYEKAFVLTADSDLCPAIDLVLDSFPEKEISIVTPPGRYEIARQLRNMATTHKIKQKHLKKHLLPENLTDTDGNVVVTRPLKYAPPV
jgi:uncharacterized LabA/DUF88 family protein